MNKSEAKFHNTAVKMNEALFRLLEQRPFVDISIMEVCNEAEVNRSTFYAHYNNTYDLLQEARDYFMNKFFNNFHTTINDYPVEELNVEEFVSARYIIPYLEFVKKYKGIFKVFMNNLNAFNPDGFYKLLLEKLWIPSCEARGITDKSVITYMSKFYLSGMISIVVEWLNNNCEDDILFVCEVIILCVRPNPSYGK